MAHAQVMHELEGEWVVDVDIVEAVPVGTSVRVDRTFGNLSRCSSS